MQHIVRAVYHSITAVRADEIVAVVPCVRAGDLEGIFHRGRDGAGDFDTDLRPRRGGKVLADGDELTALQKNIPISAAIERAAVEVEGTVFHIHAADAAAVEVQGCAFPDKHFADAAGVLRQRTAVEVHRG
ncbi:MAG: hypothetical protein Q4D44_00555, partial [Eubacteriales bacterium]|nr:hypothetical protein [Eubacteriales bacterium]